MSLSAPQPLAGHHDTLHFHSGVDALDRWLRRDALQAQTRGAFWHAPARGASHTFVACEGSRVLGYFTWAIAAVAIDLAGGDLRRPMPDLVAVAELRRLAVDRTLQGRGIGRALVRDACLRITAAAEAVGIRAVIAHALSPRARDFFLRVGFEPSPLDPMTLMAALGGWMLRSSAS